MKIFDRIRQILFVFVVAGLAACGGGGGGGGSSTTTSTAPVYAPAPQGTPTGTPVTQTIDENGGSVTSADGFLTLTIPVGVLSAPTEITLQPITNTGPNGMGLAYRLGPDGTTFSSAVTLTFHLTDAQALGLAGDFIATQHADGFWYSQPGQTRDAMAKTISVTATHFSDWTLLQTLTLKPDQASLRANTTQDFVPYILFDQNDDDLLANPVVSETEVMLPTPYTDQLQHEKKHEWAVNNIVGGNEQYGHIEEQSHTGHFTAPASRPQSNPVIVTFTVETDTSKVIAPATVDIYDQERWTGSSTITFTDGTSLTASWTFVQQGDPVATQSGTRYDFDVEGGTVTFTPLTTTSDGCPLTVTPVMHTISPGEGSMSAEYTVQNGLESPMVSGGGATVWPATYTTYCSAGTQDIPGSVDAEWWPMAGGLPTPVLAENGGADIIISTPTASGVVHLHRQ